MLNVCIIFRNSLLVPLWEYLEAFSSQKWHILHASVWSSQRTRFIGSEVYTLSGAFTIFACIFELVLLTEKNLVGDWTRQYVWFWGLSILVFECPWSLKLDIFHLPRIVYCVGTLPMAYHWADAFADKCYLACRDIGSAMNQLRYRKLDPNWCCFTIKLIRCVLFLGFEQLLTKWHWQKYVSGTQI